MYETILVPTDGSDGTEKALRHAIEIAGTRGSTLHALSVVDRRVYISGGDDRESLRETLRRDAESAVEAVRDRAEAAGITVRTAVRDGVPFTEILDYAAENDVDLVVIGTHGRTGRERLVNMGSVTERVVGNAGRPVLVVDIGDGRPGQQPL